MGVVDLEGRLDAAWELRRTDPAAAVEQAESLRDLAAERGDDAARCRSLTVAGAGHVARNDYPAALRALLEALTLLDAVDAPQRARTLSEAGYVDALVGDTALGVERLLAALEISEELLDRRNQTATLNRLGIVFYDRGDLDEAQHHYERALERCDDEVLRAGVCNNLAKVLTERGAFERALEHLRVARDGFEAAGDRRGLGMTFHNAAVVNEHVGDADRVRDQLETSIALYEEAGHVHGACEARIRLARQLLTSGEPARALALLERAHGEAEELGFTTECIAASEVLVDLHEAAGRLPEALDWMRHLRQAERRQFDHGSEQRLRSLQVRYQLERLQRDSITDALTELLNRRGLDQTLPQVVAQAREEGTELALLLLDLDDFKHVNDAHSHTVGDEVLRAVGRILRAGTRPTDRCARLGGEEFVVLLPDCDLAQARRVAEQLRHRIAAHDWDALGQGLTVTTSVGSAVLSQVGDADDLIDAADRALYDAKRGGKDLVR